jgi:ribosomal protein S7
MNKHKIISLIKILQKKGKKEFSELIVFNVFRFVKKTSSLCPFIFFVESLNKAKPYAEIKLIRISGTNYKVPVEINFKRQKNLVLKWLIVNAFRNEDSCIELNLMKEILNTCNLASNTTKQLNDVHKIAELNRIYMQYRY